jgi:hypothetical protein
LAARRRHTLIPRNAANPRGGNAQISKTGFSVFAGEAGRKIRRMCGFAAVRNVLLNNMKKGNRLEMKQSAGEAAAIYTQSLIHRIQPFQPRRIAVPLTMKKRAHSTAPA